MTPGRRHFWPQGHNLNKLGEGPVGDATYAILKLIALWFQIRRFFKSFHLENLFLACVTWICNGPEPFEQFLKGAKQGSFLPSLV